MHDLPPATGPIPVDGLARTRAELLLGARERDFDPLRRDFDLTFDAPGSRVDLREVAVAQLAQLTARLGSVVRRDPTRSLAIDGTKLVVRRHDEVAGWIDTADGQFVLALGGGRPSLAAGRGEAVLRIATWWAGGMPEVDPTGALAVEPAPEGSPYARITDPETLAPISVDARRAEAVAAAASIPSDALLDSLGPELPAPVDEARVDRAVASLLGGALGDALGAPIEFASTGSIAELGLPLRAFLPMPGAPTGAVTDDTQMSLFTAEALSDPGVALDDIGAVRHRVALAYVDWFTTQGEVAAPTDTGSALLAEAWLHARRAPGTATMAALAALSRSGDRTIAAQNDSKGCGTVMRSAPFGIPVGWSAVDAFRAAAACAAITHGHPEAAVAAGAVASLVACLVAGGELHASVWTATRLARWSAPASLTASLLANAVALAQSSPGDPQSLARLGEGWVAEEALAIAVYAALSFPAPDGVGDALSLSVAHGGDSDSTGAICGNIVGAAWGTAALPAPLVDTVEGRATIESVADRLARREDHPRPTRTRSSPCWRSCPR